MFTVFVRESASMSSLFLQSLATQNFSYIIRDVKKLRQERLQQHSQYAGGR